MQDMDEKTLVDEIILSWSTIINFETNEILIENKTSSNRGR